MVAVIKVNYKSDEKNKIPTLSLNYPYWTNFNTIEAHLYTSGGEEISAENLTPVWKVLKPKANNNNTYIKVTSTTNNPLIAKVKNIKSKFETNNIFSNIIQVQIRYDGKYYFATLPIVTTQDTENYHIYLLENTGFQ